MRLTPWLLFGGALAWAFGACAQGSDIETVGAGGSASVDGGGGAAAIGQPCQEQSDCADGAMCTKVGEGKYCTTKCPPACPDGTYCALIDGDPLCVPNKDQLCTQCETFLQCQESDACLKAPAGDKFCAIDCTTLGDCPNGFTCMDQTEYESGPSGDGGVDGGADGGTSDGGATDASTSGSGGKPPAGLPYKFCVPSGGASCPCTDKRDGVTRACSVTSSTGTCKGTEKCDGKDAMWSACSAPMPTAETCNGKDDDCNGQIDEGDPSTLCASHGQPPPHTSWVCAAGSCVVGSCQTGWTQYPSTSPSDGCTCPVEVSEANDVCSNAVSAGTITDTGAPIQIQGTLSSDSDVDVWTFQANDAAEAGTNSYHVSVTFTAPVPNNEFVFDVIRGATCTDNPTGPGASIKDYDWCVNGTSADGTEGEGSCGPTAAIHCGDHSSKYYLRVHRQTGATGTCTQYAISLSAKGGACDFTQKCM